MSCTLAGWVAREDAAVLARLVGRAGVLVHEQGERLWLRVDGGDLELAGALARIDLVERFELRGDGALVRAGGRVPRGWLDGEGWIDLARWVRTELPQVRWATRAGGGLALGLVRGGTPRAADGLSLPWERFARWAETASALRFEGLRCACSADGRALVLGRPQPALDGTRLFRDGSLLLPCGYRLEPRVDAGCAARALGLGAGELALWQAIDRFEVLPEQALVAVTRGTVRGTTAELAS